jgi:hypothetical protein
MKNMIDAEAMAYIAKMWDKWTRIQEEEKKRKEKEAKLKEAWKIYEEIRENREE